MVANDYTPFIRNDAKLQRPRKLVDWGGGGGEPQVPNCWGV